MRYVICDDREGVFLGTHVDTTEDPEGIVYVLWSRDNVFNCSKAYSFENKEDAIIFTETTLRRWPKAQVKLVLSEEKYVDIVDLIKCGLADYTHDMIDCLPMPSEQIH